MPLAQSYPYLWYTDQDHDPFQVGLRDVGDTLYRLLRDFNAWSEANLEAVYGLCLIAAGMFGAFVGGRPDLAMGITAMIVGPFLVGWEMTR